LVLSTQLLRCRLPRKPTIWEVGTYVSVWRLETRIKRTRPHKNHAPSPVWRSSAHESLPRLDRRSETLVRVRCLRPSQIGPFVQTLPVRATRTVACCVLLVAAHARAVATAKGRRIVRPVLVDRAKLDYAAHLRDTGHTIAEIVAKTGIPRASLYRHLLPRPAPTVTANPRSRGAHPARRAQADADGDRFCSPGPAAALAPDSVPLFLTGRYPRASRSPCPVRVSTEIRAELVRILRSPSASRRRTRTRRCSAPRRASPASR